MLLKNYIEEKRREKERAAKLKKAKNIAIGTTIGTAIGAAAGLLFAPKSGKETREDIKDLSSKTAANVKDTLSTTKDKVSSFIEQKRKKAEDVGEAVKDAVKEQ